MANSSTEDEGKEILFTSIKSRRSRSEPDPPNMAADEDEHLAVPPAKKIRYNQPRNAVLTCRCDFPGGTGQQHWREFPGLNEVLPGGYDYKVCQWSQLASLSQFCTTLRLPLTEFDQLQDWLDKFLDKTKTTFRKKRTYKEPNIVKNLFKVDLCCQHAARGKSAKLRPSKKNTDCKSTLTLLLKKVVKGSRSSDPHLKTLPTIIKLNWEHNHTINTAEALKFRDVSEETDEELRQLLREGITVTEVLNIYKQRLQHRWGDQFQSICEDRSYLPDYGYVHRLKKSIEVNEGITFNSTHKRISQLPKVNSKKMVKSEKNLNTSLKNEDIGPLQAKSDNVPSHKINTYLTDIDSDNDIDFLNDITKKPLNQYFDLNCYQTLETNKMSQEKNFSQPVPENEMTKSSQQNITHAQGTINDFELTQRSIFPKVDVIKHSSNVSSKNQLLLAMLTTSEASSIETNISVQIDNSNKILQIDKTSLPVQTFNTDISQPQQTNNPDDSPEMYNHRNQNLQIGTGYFPHSNLDISTNRTDISSQCLKNNASSSDATNTSDSSDQSEEEEIIDIPIEDDSSDNAFVELSKSIDELDEFYEKMRNSLSERLALNSQSLEPSIKAFIENGTQLLAMDDRCLGEALKNFGKITGSYTFT